MARNRSEPAPKPPSISKSQGRRRLIALIEKGEALLAKRPLEEGQEDAWSTTCIDTLQATFGEGTNHLDTFFGAHHYVIVRKGGGHHGYDRDDEARDAELILRRARVLKAIVENLDIEIGFDEPSPITSAATFWNDIHPSIARVAKALYEGRHFAECAEAALKEINTIVKKEARQRGGEDLDGRSLMQKAFSVKNPLIPLADLSTESGQNVQQGYMEIFAGAMMGIRNPKAHANLTIDALRARHFLYLASLLAYRFDERL